MARFYPQNGRFVSDGFDAKWKVSYYGRDYPQSCTSRTGNERFTTQAVSNSLFGSQFLSILDAYRYVERSIKYGVLFLVLVFTAFFLFEVTARQKIHPFQYLSAGLAGVYLFLYITLRQQDYALLMGAIALFVVLTIVMYVTRKVDWYARDAG